MRAQIKKIQSVAAKFNKHCEVEEEPYARLTIDVPLDTTEQKQAVVDLMGLLRDELVSVGVEPYQLQFERSTENVMAV